MSKLFSFNSYTATLGQSSAGPSSAVLSLILDKPLTRTYGNATFKNYSKEYDKEYRLSSWALGKVTAVPIALGRLAIAIGDVVLLIFFNLPKALSDGGTSLKIRTFRLSRNLQEVAASLLYLVYARGGTFLRQDAIFQRQCYESHTLTREKLLSRWVAEEYPVDGEKTASKLKQLSDAQLIDILPFCTEKHYTLISDRLGNSFQWNKLNYEEMKPEQCASFFFHNPTLLNKRIAQLSAKNFRIIYKFIQESASLDEAKKLLFYKSIPVKHLENIPDLTSLPKQYLKAIFSYDENNSSEKHQSREKFLTLSAEKVLKVYDKLDSAVLVNGITDDQLDELHELEEQSIDFRNYYDALPKPVIIDEDDDISEAPNPQSKVTFPEEDAAFISKFYTYLKDDTLNKKALSERVKNIVWARVDYENMDIKLFFKLFFYDVDCSNSASVATDAICASRIIQLHEPMFTVQERFINSTQKTEYGPQIARFFSSITTGANISRIAEQNLTPENLARVFKYHSSDQNERTQGQLLLQSLEPKDTSSNGSPITKICYKIDKSFLIKYTLEQQRRDNETLRNFFQANERQSTVSSSVHVLPEWTERKKHLEEIGITPGDDEYRGTQFSSEEIKTISKTIKKLLVVWAADKWMTKGISEIDGKAKLDKIVAARIALLG